MNKSKKKVYIYQDACGNVTCKIKAGENGVTQDFIDILVEMDDKEWNKERYLHESIEVPFDEYAENVLINRIENAENEQEPEPNRMEELLKQCVERLKPEQQELHHKVMAEQKSYSEVAEEKGVTKQAIYGQMETLKRKLKKMLEELQ